MKFIKDLKLGYVSYVEAFKFIKTHRLWYYFIFPVLLFLGIYYLGFVFQELKTETVTTDDMGLVQKIWFLFLRSVYALLAVAMLSFMRYILILILSPVLSVVSERVERILTGNKYKFNLKQLIKDIKRALNLAIRNMIWELAIVYGLIIIYYGITRLIGISPRELDSFPPSNTVINWLQMNKVNFIDGFFTGMIAMLVAFYYYGFGFIDYLMERMRMDIKDSVKFVRKHKGFAVALGSIFTLIFVYSNNYLLVLREQISGGYLLVLVIIASIILAMIPIVTMVAATLGVHQIVDLKKNPFAIKDEEKLDQETATISNEVSQTEEIEEYNEDTFEHPENQNEDSDDEIVE